MNLAVETLQIRAQVFDANPKRIKITCAGKSRRKVITVNVLDFQKSKNECRKISMVTCYDYSSARAVAASNIDCILVGDSVAMVMHGHATTLSATTAMIALHTAAVARGAPAKFIVADLPFLSCRKGLKDAMD